ncbi:MAG: DUF4178 domain-containing protein [Deltaproteobacteria bacterium]|nr:DUF4178 domain-containing protein [Deltaproteobacteria bacterium]
MVATGQQAQCPNCGGPIVFRAGMSGALVCPYCSFVVVRTDQDLALRGKVARISPTQALIGLGASGNAGSTRFSVLGRVQLDHGAGPWDEWYVVAGDGTWAWLAQAQGKWLLTRESPVPAGLVPSWDAVAPGSQIAIGNVTWTVQERGVSRVVSAEGELPFPIEPGGKGLYADLVAPGGRFATLDIGDGRDPVRLFVGDELPEGALSFESTGIRGEEPKVKTGNLQCPTCGGPVPLLSADKAESAVCPSCSSLLDVDKGAFRFVEQLRQQPIRPYIPLGTKGVLRGEEWTVIAFMQRHCVVQGIAYAWREYLLFDETRGFRWLLEDNGHWTFIRTVSPAEVNDQYSRATWRDPKGGTRSFKRFAANVAVVDYVSGEVYWKVRLGEQVVATDYIDPPEMLSKEESDNEVTWSLGTYVEAKELWKAFRLPGSPPASSGVAPAQPKKPWALGAIVALAVTVGMCLVTCSVNSSRPHRVYVDGPIQLGSYRPPPVPGAPATSDPTDAYFTQPFHVAEETALSVEMSTTNLVNGWAGAAIALVNDTTGDVYEFDLETERWSGYEGGEYWSEGSTSASERIGEVTPGWYLMRIDPEWSQTSGQPSATLRVATADRALTCAICLFPLAWLPALFAFFLSRAHETKRWYNSNP